MIAITSVTTTIGRGQRTTAVPTLRQPRVESSRLASSTPNRDPTARTAGANVNAAATITKSAIAQGKPIELKYGNVHMVRHMHAPATVNPEPRITCDTP